MSKNWNLFAWLISLFSGGRRPEPPLPIPQSPPRPKPATQPQRKSPVLKDKILELQEYLDAEGFSPGLLDGLFGDSTEKAIRDCQRAERAKGKQVARGTPVDEIQAPEQLQGAMAISREGLQMLTASEGSRNAMYLDSKGLPTIGVGHLLTQSEITSGEIVIGETPVQWEDGLTDNQILDLLDQDLYRFEDVVNTVVYVPLSQHQLDALVHFSFNIGVTGFSRSTVVRRLNAGDYDGGADAMMMWLKPPELRGRREREVALFRDATYHGIA